MAISETMRAQIRGLEQAERNIEDGISLVQITDSALGVIQNPNLIRLRELAVQAANDTLSDSDRQVIQEEVEQVKTSINQIANNTYFNTISLLNRTAGTEGTDSVSVISGSEINLTPGSGYATAPNWIGNKIAFSEDSDIILMDENGSNKNKILTNAASPSISNDESKIAFIRDNNLFTADIDGSNETKLTTTSDVTYNSVDQSSPEWSPDGNYLFFSTDNGIEKINASNSAGRSVVISGNIKSPTLTSDGSKLVYESNGEIFQANIDGTNNKKITSGYEPTVSPNGSKIAFSNFTDIFVMNLDGSDITNVTAAMPTASLHGHNHDPSWSPDSNKLVYHSDTVSDGSGDIWSVILSGMETSSEEVSGDNIILQVGPNAGNNFSIRLTDARTMALGIEGLTLDSRDQAEMAIQLLDKAIETISSERGKFGAYQNSLQHVGNNVSNYKINITTAESRIRDLDMPKEMTKLAKQQVLLQSSQAMIAKANQIPQSLLQFLK